jgi:hypothetical protein
MKSFNAHTQRHKLPMGLYHKTFYGRKLLLYLSKLDSFSLLSGKARHLRLEYSSGRLQPCLQLLG